MTKLPRHFFQRDTCLVAQELLGKVLTFEKQQILIQETEAYRGEDDPASHAYRGETKRTTVMFGEAGFSYIYLIYGMYHCLNMVTETIDQPGAVLIRGGILLPSVHLNGPGKLCRALNINLSHNQIDLIESANFYVSDVGIKPEIQSSPRIGISKGLDKNWRFYTSCKDLAAIEINTE